MYFSAAYLRQSILLSPYETPEMRSLFSRSLKNVAGKLRTERKWRPIAVPEGVEQVCELQCFSVAEIQLVALARNSPSSTVHLQN
jgi:UTP25, NTP hydrolase-like domain